MHSASRGDGESVWRISKIFKDYQTKRDKARKIVSSSSRLSPRQKKKAENKAFQRQTMFCHPDTEPILSRPRPTVSGQRRIPVLVNARGVPFLRIKKPQPQSLSRYLRYKLAFKSKLIQRRDRLLIDALFAKDEEDWNRLIEGKEVTPPVIQGQHPLPWLEGSWLQSALESYKKAFYDNVRFEEKQQGLAEQMWKVVLAERALAAKEQVENNGRQNPN